MSFYKTNHPDCVNGLQAFHEAVNNLHTKSEAFANQFGGEAGVYQDRTRTFFRGVILKNADRNIWASQVVGGSLYRPRAKAKVKESIEAWKAIKEQWIAGVEDLKDVEKSLFYSPLGLGNGLFFGHFSVFFHEGWLYLNTDQKVLHCTEILGSEYHLAKEAFEKASKN